MTLSETDFCAYLYCAQGHAHTPLYLYFYISVFQPFLRRGTLDLALHISRYPLRKTPIF
jgi:hypothetical protein